MDGERVGLGETKSRNPSRAPLVPLNKSNAYQLDGVMAGVWGEGSGATDRGERGGLG